MSQVAEHTPRAVTSAGRAVRSPAIDGIRGLAAVTLLTIHVGIFSGLLGTRAFGTPRPPSNFLGAFFVSGFPSFIGVLFVLPALYFYLPLARAVIAGTRRPPQRDNVVRRLLRLLPAYYASVLVVMLTLNRGVIDGVWYVLRPILLLQVYLPSPVTPNLINGLEISWTVPSMVQWYLALPLIAWATHRYAARGATPAARARRLMLPVPILIAIGIGWLLMVKARNWDNRMVFWWPQGFAPTIAIGMGLAILLALAQVSPADTAGLLRAAARHPNACWLGALVVYLVNCVRPFSVIGMDAIYSTAGLLVTYLMVALFGLLAVLPLVAPGARTHAVATMLGVRPLPFLGRICYGIYLWHFAVMHFWLQPGSIITGHARPIRELYGVAGFWQLEIATVAGSVLFATVSHYLLEQPVAAWFERYLRAGRARVTVPAEAPRRRPRVLVPLALEPAGPALTAEEAAAATAAAAADRDAIRANLVDLENSFGRQLLAGAALTGQTEARWRAAVADLAALWETFNAYSVVVEEATAILAGGRRPASAELARVAGLLTGPAIVLTNTPAPLHQRRITDNGHRRLTVDAAVARMDGLFNAVAVVVTTAEAAWTQVTDELNAVSAELAAARGRAAGRMDEVVTESFAVAEAELSRLRQVLATDPLALWPHGHLSPELDTLRRTAADAVQRCHQLANAHGDSRGQR